MQKYLLITLSLIAFIRGTAHAEIQKIIDNDSLLKVYLLTEKFSMDTTAHAIILQERSSADITIKDAGGFYQRMEYTVEKCFKIINKEALDLAEIAIPYTADLKVKDVNVVAISLENGNIVKNKVTRSDVIKEKLSDDARLYKFNLPNVKPGTIIYYTYTYKMDLGRAFGHDYFPLFWTFQNHYPTIDSRFELKIPPEVNFKAIVKNTTFTDVTSADALEQSTHAKLSTLINPNKENTRASQRHIIWKRSHIEALTQNDYIINPESKQEKINIYIAAWFPNRNYKETRPVYTSWEEANNIFFYNQRYLGGWIFHPHDTLSHVLNKIIAGEKENLSAAKAIYKYVRDSIRCTGYSRANRVWSSRSPKTAFAQKQGTESDKNILLAALYRKAGFKSFPVVLSTTSNEKISAEQFEPDALNHLITMVVVDSICYYVDPSNSFLPFGVLRPGCYNNFAWLINEKGLPLDMKADNLQDKNICMATLKPTDKKGIFNLKMDQRLGNVSAPMIRTLWNEDSVKTKEFLDKDIKSLNYKIKILDRRITNIKNPDTTLTISYNLELELDESGNYVYLNPFFKRLTEYNPFKEATRKYPVEFPNAVNDQFILKFTLPEGYTLEDSDVSAKFDFKNGLMSYTSEILYDANLKTLSLKNVLISKTTEVSVADYKELRSFYESMVADQNKSIVLKKIN